MHILFKCIKELLVLLPKLSKNLCEVLEFSMCLKTKDLVFTEEDEDTGLVERASGIICTRTCADKLSI